MKHHFGSSDGVNIIDVIPSSPSGPDNNTFKSALNKFMEMRISSPSFKNSNKSITELKVLSTTSHNKNNNGRNANINSNALN